MSLLLFPPPRVIPKPLAVYNGHADDTVDRTSYSITDVPIGEPHPSRVVIFLCLAGRTTVSGTLAIDSPTFNGTPLIELGRLDSGTAPYLIGSLPLPTGTSGTVAFGIGPGSQTMLRATVATFSIYNALCKRPTDAVLLPNGNPVTADINVPAGGIVCVFARSNTQSGVRTYTWSGATEVDDYAVESAASVSAAFYQNNTGVLEVARTISASQSGTGNSTGLMTTIR